MVGLLALAVGGRRLEPDERAMLEDLATVAVVADPRVWPLKLVRVAASYGRYLPALAAATVSFDGARVGYPIAGQAAEILVQLQHRIAGNEPIDEASDPAVEEECRRLFAAGARPVGFGVAFRHCDERLVMLDQCVASRARSDLSYWRLFKRLERAVRRVRKLEPNICLGAAAVCLDIGFSPSQIGALVMALATVDLWANAFEGAEQAPKCLQKLPDDSVRYVGPPTRLSPRAISASSGKNPSVNRGQ